MSLFRRRLFLIVALALALITVSMTAGRTSRAAFTPPAADSDPYGLFVDSPQKAISSGFDPANPSKWDQSKAKPVEWIKIHNLPDHVYFNHSQHVRVGQVQCQTCHGEITAMDEVKQESELSMGWCINCHRQTHVNFNYDTTKGNRFYSIYEKFHNDIKNHKMDSVTVQDIGGLECQRCHY